MNFGFSPSDVAGAAVIARNIYKSYHESPGDFKALSRSIGALAVTLELTEETLQNRQPNELSMERLKLLTSESEELMGDLRDTLHKHQNLGLMDRLRWSRRDADALRLRIIPSRPPITNEHNHRHHIHVLSPTGFLRKAEDVAPDAIAIHHTNADSQTIRLTYHGFADRSKGFAYYLRKFGYKRVGILCPNTPAFIISIFGIAAAGAVITAVDHGLKTDDIAYILDHSEVDAVVVDQEFVGLLDEYKKNHPNVKMIVDEDKDMSGQFYDAVKEGWGYDKQTGRKGWGHLEAQSDSEDSLIAVAYTSGTTGKPKGAEYTHRGAYLAAMGNIIESGLSYPQGRVGYLWTLDMFHAMGWTFPWAVTAVRGTHYCLRKMDYSEIWRLLKEENITHFNASPIVTKQLCAHPLAEALPKAVQVAVAGSSPTPHLFETMTNLNLHPLHVYGLTETYGPITKGYQTPAWDHMPKMERYQMMVRQGHGFVTSLPIRVVRTDLPEGEIVNVKKDRKEIGEIVFLGNICVRGYHKNPQATRKLFAGGVLHSGDLAVWHEDGSVQILGRREDIIICGNPPWSFLFPSLPRCQLLIPIVMPIKGERKISSIALESTLEMHPDILEAGVVAVGDERWGERPKAYAIVKPEAHVSGREVIEWVEQNGDSEFVVPLEVEFVEGLPRTSTGKLIKNVMREWS